MNLPFNIARRYIFSKKKTNVINIISVIVMSGIAIGTAALVCIMSVFNGFGELIGSVPVPTKLQLPGNALNFI